MKEHLLLHTLGRLGATYLLAAVLIGCSATGTPRAGDETTFREHVASIRVGHQFSNSDLEPAGDETAIGVQYAWRITDDGYGFDFGAKTGDSSGQSSAGRVEYDAYEFYLGVRRDFPVVADWIEPYGAFGLTFHDAEIEQGGGPALSDRSIGFYVDAGARHWFADSYSLQVGLRATLGTSLHASAMQSITTDYVEPYIGLGVSF